MQVKNKYCNTKINIKHKEMPKHLDATDGLAAAVCHIFKEIQ